MDEFHLTLDVDVFKSPPNQDFKILQVLHIESCRIFFCLLSFQRTWFKSHFEILQFGIKRL